MRRRSPTRSPSRWNHSVIEKESIHIRIHFLIRNEDSQVRAAAQRSRFRDQTRNATTNVESTPGQFGRGSCPANQVDDRHDHQDEDQRSKTDVHNYPLSGAKWPLSARRAVSEYLLVE